MVLRKPYAFFIKHFKLFHLILSGLVIYSMIRISGVVSFLNEYTSNSNTVKLITESQLNSVFGTLDFIIPIAILLFSVLLLVVMTMKKKPNKFYAYSTGVSIVLLIMNSYGYSTVKQLIRVWLDSSKLSTLADMYIFVMIALIVEVAVALSRAIGFNISRFDFNNDILQFDLTEEDNAEFEVAVDFDINDVKREVQKKSRYFKYFIKENKSTLLWTIVVFAIFIGLFGVYSFAKNRRTIVKTSTLNYNSFTFEILNTYIVNTDVCGNKLDDNLNLVVIEANVTNNIQPTKNSSGVLVSRNEKIFPTGTLSLSIGDETYSETNKYSNYLSDIGTVYLDEKINGQNTMKNLFVFVVPENHVHSKMYLGVRDLNTKKTVYTKIKPNRLNNEEKVVESNIKEDMSFNDTTIGKSKINIESYDIQDRFEVKYKFCVKENVCKDSIDYITGTPSGNKDKAVMKIKGVFEFDDNSTIKSITALINKYGYIEYTKNGNVYRQSTNLKELKSSKVSDENVYYIEVDADIKGANTIVLGFKVRGIDYKYSLTNKGTSVKGGNN